MQVNNLFLLVTSGTLIMFAILLMLVMVALSVSCANRAKYLALFVAGSAVLMSVVAIVMIGH